MSTFPATRLRRLRSSGALRSLVRETRLDLDDFVMPLFVGPTSQANEQLPALGRFTVDDLVAEVEELTRLGVGAVILFGIPDEKDELGSGAWDEQGVVQRALRALRPAFPELLAHRRLPLRVHLARPLRRDRDGVVANDETLDLLVRTSVSHVEAGADAVCPSDMMDGRVAAFGPRSEALRRDADRRLLGEVRLGLLRALPRGGRVGALVRRPPRLPDGPPERPRGAARVRARSRGGRRRADGQAGAARTST